MNKARNRVYGLLLAVLALAASPPPPIDYQEVARGTNWDWSDMRASVRESARQVKEGEYQAAVRTVADRPKEVLVQVTKGGKPVYSFSGHSGTVFAIEEAVLYRALFNPDRAGCDLVAYDLVQGKQLWKSTLRGLGTVTPGPCRNAINLDVLSKVIRVFGKESAGRYFEIVDRGTGKTLGHKVFSDKKSARK